MPAAFTIINILTALHLSLGCILLYDPKILTDNDFIIIFGEALSMPPAPSAFNSNAATTGLLFLLLGLTDFLIIISPSNLFQREYWRTQTPFRAAFFTLLSFYIFMTIPKKEEWRGVQFPIKNGLVFTWSFVEFVTWYLVFAGLNEEAKNIRIERAGVPGSMGEAGGEAASGL